MRADLIKVKCTQCGSDLTRNNTQFDVSKNKRFFCNKKCAGIWKANNLVGQKVYNYKEGTKKYYGPNGRVQKRKAAKRDGYACRRCHRAKKELGRNPDVHHIIPFETFESYKEANRLSNLITLCNRCHRLIEKLFQVKKAS